MTEPTGPLPPHWQDVYDAVKGRKDFENDESAMCAAEMIDSPCVVVISVNREEGKFEARCFGDGPGWREMASKMTDAMLAGLDADPPSD